MAADRAPRSRADAGHKSLPWRRDPVILRRLEEVERRHLAGESNRAIAAALDVDPATIRLDLKRANELWLEQAASSIDEHRARKLRELEDIKRRALAAADFDEAAERAVLFGEGPLHVQRDDRGSAQFRGNKSAAINVARQAVMDAAKLLGLVIERVDLTANVRAEAEKLARELGLNVEDVLAEAEAIVKAGGAR